MVVHDVEGVVPEVCCASLAVARAGALRDELHYVALDQGLARDAAASSAVSATRTAGLDEQLRGAVAAGLVEGRLHLDATRRVQALRDDVPRLNDRELLGEDLDGLRCTVRRGPRQQLEARRPAWVAAGLRLVTPRLDGA